MQELNIDLQIFKQIRKPKLSNVELIAMILTAEYMSIDSEYQLFRKISGTYLSGLIERSVYNRRKQKLFPAIELIRKAMANKFTETENYFIVDSMSLEICRSSRTYRSVICKEQDYCYPDKGYLSSEYQLDLFQTANIKLETPKKKKPKTVQSTAICI